MGFHIVNLEEGILEHSYVQNEKELANNKTIKEDTIIYQGEEN